MDEAHLKIIFAGSVGSGKTTSINSISDIETFQTEEIATDDLTREIKERTTVAMDYGQIHLKNETVIHLYGAPGQGRFDFMWEILSQGALGIVILINNNASSPLEELDAYFDAFSEHIHSRSIVIGITCTDLSQEPNLDDYRRHVGHLDHNIPVFTLDARDPDMVRTLVKTLMYRKDAWLN